MDQFLASLPKSFIAIAVLVLTLLLLRQMSPPVTICDAQMELFRDSQRKFLYPPKSEGGIQNIAPIEVHYRKCLENNSPGGCFELFNGLKKMTMDLRNVPEQCAEVVSQEAPVLKWIWRSMKIMVQIAWGEQVPSSYLQKHAWFDASELTLFCDIRRQALRIFGSEVFSQRQEDMLKGMPKAEKLTREQVWPRSLLSTPCESYR